MVEIYSVATGKWEGGKAVQWKILGQKNLFNSKISRTFSSLIDSLGFSLKTAFGQGFFRQYHKNSKLESLFNNQRKHNRSSRTH